MNLPDEQICSQDRRGRRTRRVGARERGAALVEFAIIAPLFFLLIFGIIEFGSAYNDYQSVRQGAREGARQIVVGDFASASSSCNLNGAASSAPTAVKQAMCLTKTRTGLDDSKVRVRIRLVDETPLNDHRGDSVKVCVAQMVDTITGFLDPFLEGRSLTTSIEMRGEQINLGFVPGDYHETDPSGENWSWCDA